MITQLNVSYLGFNDKILNFQHDLWVWDQVSDFLVGAADSTNVTHTYKLGSCLAEFRRLFYSRLEVDE